MPISLFLYALPQATGNTWLFSTCISRQCYTNLNQPHFKYLSPNSFTFLQDAVKVQSSEAEETAVKGQETPGDSLPPAGNTWLFSTCISHQCYTNLNQPHFTKFIHFFAGRGESPEFRGRGDSSERTGDTWGLPPPAGNTWLFSTCISHQCYTNLNQPHFTKFIHFFAGRSESPGFRG